MSIAGLIMQQLTKNKFVSPTTAGTIDSARFGVLITLMLFTSASPLLKVSVFFAFSLIGTFIFMKILDNIQFKNPVFFSLVGLVFGSFIEFLSTFFLFCNDLF